MDTERRAAPTLLEAAQQAAFDELARRLRELEWLAPLLRRLEPLRADLSAYGLRLSPQLIGSRTVFTTRDPFSGLPLMTVAIAQPIGTWGMYLPERALRDVGFVEISRSGPSLQHLPHEVTLERDGLHVTVDTPPRAAAVPRPAAEAAA